MIPCLPRLEARVSLAPIMKRIAFLVASIGAMLALNSCLQNEMTITVKADGSGTVVEETVFGAQMSAMMGGLGGLGGEAGAPKEDPLAEMFSEDKAKEKAAKMGEGVTVAKVEKIDKDGKKGGRVTYAFKDINKLKIGLSSGMDALDSMGDAGPGAGAEDDAEEAEDAEDPVQFKMEGKKLTVMLPQPDKDAKAPAVEIPEKEEEKSPEDAQAEAMAKAMFADMKMSVKLVIDPAIAKTDATHVEGNTITLMEMNFGELMKDDKGMKLLDQMEGKSPQEVAKLVEGIKGVKFETKEKITVDVK